MMRFLFGPDDALGRRQWLCVSIVITIMVIGGAL